VARRRTCKENRKPQVGARSRSISSGGRQPAVAAATVIAMRFAGAASAASRHMGHRHCQRVTVIHGGLRPPLLVVPAFAGRRNCDFCDAQTHMHEERRVSARRGCGSDPATTIHQTFARCHRAREQERRQPAVARRRTCKENRKPQVGARSRSISSGGRQTAVIAATVIAMRVAGARSAVSRIWGIVLASAFP